MINNTVKNFASHCLQDSEFLAGGIPTKEDFYCKKLGWDKDSEELSKFYEAMYILSSLESRKA